MRAEALPGDLGRFRLVTFAQSLHGGGRAQFRLPARSRLVDLHPDPASFLARGKGADRLDLLGPDPGEDPLRIAVVAGARVVGVVVRAIDLSPYTFPPSIGRFWCGQIGPTAIASPAEVRATSTGWPATSTRRSTRPTSSLGAARAQLTGGRHPAGQATQRPWSRAAAGDATFRTRNELKAIYQDGAGLRPDDDVVVYCRIGERSSHTWFVLHHLLGYPQVRNYDGSWTEWGNTVRVPIRRSENP